MAVPREEEKAVLKQVKKGDTAAFEKLLFWYEKGVFNYIHRLSERRQDAEDLTQETFLKAWRKIDLVDPEKSFGPWLYKIAVNTVWDALRRKRKAPELFIIDDPESAFETTDPRDTYITIENAKDLASALDALKPIHKTVLLLFYREDMDYRTIAETLSLPMNTVKTHLYRAKKELKNNLEEFYG